MIPLRICLRDKVQRTGPAQIFQNRVGVRHTGNLDIDPVCAFLVDLRLRAVPLHTLLELINRIVHILRRRIFIAYHLIGDAHTACEVKSLLDSCG